MMEILDSKPQVAAHWTAFSHNRIIAQGTPHTVAWAVKRESDNDSEATLLVFNDATGKVVDLDLRGSAGEVVARLSPDGQFQESFNPVRSPGRPKLGVVAREVTLLPRHWEWLGEQPGGASVALRKLVESARASTADRSKKRQACGIVYCFMTTMAGNLAGYEEAVRALYADDKAGFEKRIKPWPADIADHILQLAAPAFAESP